jgi:hypothetical protein
MNVLEVTTRKNCDWKYDSLESHSEVEASHGNNVKKTYEIRNEFSTGGNKAQEENTAVAYGEVTVHRRILIPRT